MNAEELYQAITEAPDALVEEAADPALARRGPVRHWKGLVAAALAVAVGLGGMGLSGLLGGRGFPPGAASGMGGHEDGSLFLSYGGPVFPLTVDGDAAGLRADRDLSYDFSGWGTEDRDLAVTDAYTLTNSGDADRDVTLLYPYAGTLTDPAPALTLDGAALEAEQVLGDYAGGFTGAGSGPLTSVNLAHPRSWEDYKALLSDGGYLASALDPKREPVLDQAVTVYEFSGFAAEYEGAPAATLAMEFSMDDAATTVLTYGFDGAAWDEERGWRQCSFFVPQPGTAWADRPKLVAVVGEDIGEYTLQGYVDGGCDAPLDGVAAQVERHETTLGQLVDRLARWEVERDDSGLFLRNGLDSPDQVPYGLYYRAVCQLLAEYGPLADGGVERYEDGRLDEILSEAASMKRVLYLRAQVTIPAGGSVAVSARLDQEGSFDFAGTGGKNQGVYGYDMVTQVGTALDFGTLTARLEGAGSVEIVRQNYGFDLAGGVTEVVLDPAQEHYYLEVKARGDG